ncbi:MAG: IS3 family transposase [Mesorhizobium sp.]|uniref:IS3 family transposase n=1 Tax=unclassified Mesorhizobium TaxID=325217 RepID=UPI000FCB6F01|nr:MULTISPECIES: IS3 family transposase [unclassified Mesorhizobium]RUW42296.1 IS3 family transposase [Mesorhizobium sp. M2A.F.Ca.ET.015.02.1.1]RVC96466.1 IS3 family transposase [Mesorhizobium sp. M2A.F.Ca.ET.017.03.2.1]RVD03273.1 IS3 family transposase [Mesorhizobium sp. M2A.F.Ca.ET.029.05.1.1]RWC37916.1 MAG: IS3 family transposase [Mesorhizobium sp.]RWC84122.1 MAG: IS3 family transposase [Mesorhizobium sp.]
MRQKSGTGKAPAEQVIKDIRRVTRKQYGAEEKIRIVLEGLRGEESIAALCRREGIAESLYYNWSKEFLEAGKKRLAGDTARAATSDEVKVLRKEARDLKEVVAEQALELRILKKKHDRGWGRRRMRYPASEKLEIIRLVEQSHLSARRTLQKLGIPRSTFNRWYDRFLAGGVDALEDRRPRPNRVWNRIPDEVRDQLIDLALNEPELSPRELAVTFTDTKGYFVSESSVYRLLKVHDLITSPAFIVIKAADEFHDKTTAPNQLWQTDFTYLKVIGWGWFYLSTVLDDFSRHIIAWKLCTTMKAGDVTDTLTMALRASGRDSAKVMQRPRLLSDNGPSYVSSDLATWLSDKGMEHTRGAPCHPQTQGKIERWHQTLKNRILLENYFLPGDLERQIAAFIDHYNHRRYHESLGNLTPADVYLGRGDIIMLERERIKRETIRQRRLLHREAAA